MTQQRMAWRRQSMSLADGLVPTYCPAGADISQGKLRVSSTFNKLSWKLMFNAANTFMQS